MNIMYFSWQSKYREIRYNTEAENAILTCAEC